MGHVVFLQGAALGAMVGQMTFGKRQFENLDGIMRRLIPPFHQAMNDLLLMVDADSSAFNSYMVRGTRVQLLFRLLNQILFSLFFKSVLIISVLSCRQH